MALVCDRYTFCYHFKITLLKTLQFSNVSCAIMAKKRKKESRHSILLYTSYIPLVKGEISIWGISISKSKLSNVFRNVLLSRNE